MKRLLTLILFGLLGLSLLVFVACPPDDDDDSGDNDDDSGDDDDDNDDNDSAAGCNTWTDSSSGLMWENGEEFFGTWNDAIEYCFELSCGGYDDWRMPTIDELRSLIVACAATETGGSCEVTDPGCTEYGCRNLDCAGCKENEGPALDGYYLPDDLDGDYYVYWSATEISDEEEFAWLVSYKFAAVTSGFMSSDYSARCVRGSQL